MEAMSLTVCGMEKQNQAAENPMKNTYFIGKETYYQ